MSWLAFAAAAALAAAVALWWYGRREERVRGLWAAALLRGAALFFFLSAPWMPPLRGADDSDSHVAILVDRSRSMRHPVGDSVGATRVQAAQQVAGELLRIHRSASIWSFSETTIRIEPEDLEQLAADGEESSVLGAIERARASGADSLIIVTDGELRDREAGRRMAFQLGVAVREVRVADVTARIGIRSLTAPLMVTSGDTLEVRAEILASAGAPDSATVVLDFGGRAAASKTVELPGAGRSADVVFRLPAELSADTAEWRSLDLGVEGTAPSRDAAAWARRWVAVSPVPTGAVLISVDPDWEARHLSPVLDRSVPGGVRSFLRIADGTWVRFGARPAGGIPEASVRGAAGLANLLVIQGDPAELPAWLEEAARRRPALMYLVRGAGPVPGTGISVREALPGEWYADMPPPPGPVAGALFGQEAGELPPLNRLYRSTSGAAGSVLTARRDRRGPASPVGVIGSREERRWAAILGEGSWRWAARNERGLALYRGLFAGLTRWLLERADRRPVQLANPYVRAGDSIRWRSAPDVRDLAIRLSDSSGAVVWSSDPQDASAALVGPPLERGDAGFVATGTTGEGRPFRVERPFHVNARSEDLPIPAGPLLDVPAADVSGGRAAVSSDPPVWPFAVALALLCAEWLWRRRIGLR